MKMQSQIAKRDLFVCMQILIHDLREVCLHLSQTHPKPKPKPNREPEPKPKPNPRRLGIRLGDKQEKRMNE